MYDVSNILKSVERVYNSNTNFQILKDFERVLDELDLYVYPNWEDGELASGPTVDRYWVTCEFMWDFNKMPDPTGGSRLLDYDCSVIYIQSEITEPRIIRKPSDVRPGTKKGKLDSKKIWLVKIKMPKKLISDIWVGYQEKLYSDNDIQNKQVGMPDEHDNDENDVAADAETDLDMPDDMPSDTPDDMENVDSTI